MDMVLVGDSLAMVALGYEDTSEVTVEDMLVHCRSVARGARAAFKVNSETEPFYYHLDPPHNLASCADQSKKAAPNKPDIHSNHALY